MTESVSPAYLRLFRISARDATATVKVKVVKPPPCCGQGGARRAGGARSLPRAPSARALANPPRSALPDLVPLPAWSISVSHPRKQTHDYLDFAATVWVGGHGPLDVEGFRCNGSLVMKAYQYFLLLPPAAGQRPWHPDGQRGGCGRGAGTR